jgi:hypothetical protein
MASGTGANQAIRLIFIVKIYQNPVVEVNAQAVLYGLVICVLIVQNETNLLVIGRGSRAMAWGTMVKNNVSRLLHPPVLLAVDLRDEFGAGGQVAGHKGRQQHCPEQPVGKHPVLCHQMESIFYDLHNLVQKWYEK